MDVAGAAGVRVNLYGRKDAEDDGWEDDEEFGTGGRYVAVAE